MVCSKFVVNDFPLFKNGFIKFFYFFFVAETVIL